MQYNSNTKKENQFKTFCANLWNEVLKDKVIDLLVVLGKELEKSRKERIIECTNGTAYKLIRVEDKPSQKSYLRVFLKSGIVVDRKDKPFNSLAEADALSEEFKNEYKEDLDSIEVILGEEK